MYATGKGVPQNDAEAVTWYRQAAEQGHADAQFTLGVMYFAGKGIPQDDAEAVTLYRLAALGNLVSAAEQGHAEAQFTLGVMYDTGKGVPQDNVEAHMWLNLAASPSAGRPGARPPSGEQRERTVTTRDAVAERMTPADLGEAQRRAREWYAAHPVP